MNRNLIYALIAVAIVAAGVGAFSLGSFLQARSSLNTSTSTTNVSAGNTDIGPAPQGLAGTRFADPVDVSQVSLTGPQGEVSMNELGKPMLVFFGFTHCPDVCPLTLSNLAQMYEELGSEDFGVMMITVDPDDTPEITNAYASGFHPDFIGLSGSNSELATALKAFYIGSRELPDGLFTHTGAVIVLDEAGRMRYVYSESSIAELEQDLPVILDELKG